MSTAFRLTKTGLGALGSLLAFLILSVLIPLAKGRQAPMAPAPSSLPSTTVLANQPAGLYQVTDIVDGDTIKVRVADMTETIRLIGIDTPETVDPRKSVQCFGREASAHAKALLAGQGVTLEADPTQGERDKYGRLLRYVTLPNGAMYNLLMIQEGYAHEYTYDSNPYRYQAGFKAAEKAASTAGLGLWSRATCNGNTVQAATPSPAP